MAYCPANATAFGIDDLTDEHAAEWCRRQYRSSAQQCHGCELGIKYGVVEVAAPVVEKKLPVQSRMF